VDILSSLRTETLSAFRTLNDYKSRRTSLSEPMRYSAADALVGGIGSATEEPPARALANRESCLFAQGQLVRLLRDASW